MCKFKSGIILKDRIYIGGGNSTVKACDNSTVTLPQSSYNKRENIIISENSTLKDCKTKTIYQSGDWKFVVVEGKSNET